METPTITKKQEKKTLSARKKRRNVIKNTFLKPYDNYWPLVSTEDNDYLLGVFEETLPRLCPQKINILYKDIKSVAKQERKEFRKSFYKDCEIEKVPELIFGVNSVSKLLESKEAVAVLVESGVQPRLLVQHIIDQAVLFTIPVLVVTDLKVVFKKKCGITGAVIGLKRVPPPGKLDLILQTVSRIFENYPVPSNHINFNRKLDISTITISDSPDVSLCERVEEKPVENLLLTRPDNKKRVFVPPKSPPKSTNTFIGFSEPLIQQCQSQKAINYHHLKVKRTRKDENRNKKKIENIKRKK